jgi:hypothetical protein
MRHVLLPFKHFRTSLLLMLAVALLLAPGSAAAGGKPNARTTPTVTLTPIGDPTWRPVDFHLFSAPIGTEETGYAEFGETLLTILPEPNHASHPQLGVGPGAPHAPPYDGELADGVQAAGFHDTTRFSTSDFSNGSGIFLAWMNVPAPGTTGSSPDFESGPIIGNDLFPMHVESSTFRGSGKHLFSAPTIFDVPKLDAELTPPFDVDGHSHFPLFYADNADFALQSGQMRGNFTFETTVTDQTGSGWRIQVNLLVTS